MPLQRRELADWMRAKFDIAVVRLCRLREVSRTAWYRPPVYFVLTRSWIDADPLRRVNGILTSPWDYGVVQKTSRRSKTAMRYENNEILELELNYQSKVIHPS